MKLAYKTSGEGEPILFIHGLYGCSDNWLSTAKNIASHQFNTILVDLRNHGLSPHSSVMDYIAMTDDLAEFMEDHLIDNTIMLGHSMGGRTAMTFAARFPNKVKKLIVVDVAPVSYPFISGNSPEGRLHKNIVESLSNINLTTLSSRKEAENFLMEQLKSPRLVQFLLKNLVRKIHNQWDWKINLNAIKENLQEIFEATSELQFLGDEKKIDCPTLFIKGSNSSYIKKNDYPTIHRFFNHATIKEIHDAGHWVHAEKPEEFEKEVLAFIID